MSIAEIKYHKAIENGELAQYLGGYPAYSVQETYADMPTDYSTIFLPVSSRLGDDSGLRETLSSAIKSLANDPEYGWGAIFHITNLAILRKRSGVDLLTPDLLDSVRNSLRNNRDRFKSLKRWIGKDFTDGVWEMVKTENRILHEDENITVLPEEL
jgi:hypothetical protein